MNQTPPSIVSAPTYLIDANVLLRLAQSSHTQHITARLALSALRQSGARLVTAPQSLYEFWAVATRPGTARGGLGLSAEGATAYLNLFEREFPPLAEVPVYGIWRRLLKTCGVVGLNTHDARLAAFVVAHSIPLLLTFNVKDFKRYSSEGITVVDPVSVPLLAKSTT